MECGICGKTENIHPMVVGTFNHNQIPKYEELKKIYVCECGAWLMESTKFYFKTGKTDKTKFKWTSSPSPYFTAEMEEKAGFFREIGRFLKNIVTRG